MAETDISRHPIIRRAKFTDLIKKAGAIDSTLALHYASHSTDPLVMNIIESSSRLAQKRIELIDIQYIFSISATYYHVYNVADHWCDFTRTYMSFPLGSKNSSMDKRKDIFRQCINEWIAKNPDASDLCMTSWPEILVYNNELEAASPKTSPTKVSPTKVTKAVRSGTNSPVRRNLLRELKNATSKFQYQPKNEAQESAKNNGLSLIERIRLKEKLNSEAKDDPFDDPAARHQRYLLEKAVSVYEVLFQLSSDRSEGDPFKLFSVAKLAEVVKDSSPYPLDRDEIVDVLHVMESKLTSGTLSIIKRNNISVIKVGKLDRATDLACLES